jgi:spore cortex formation protein SpoVR/YcgB (stage V sporulation)
MILELSTQFLLLLKIHQGELSKPPDTPIYFIYLDSKSQVLLEFRNYPMIRDYYKGFQAFQGKNERLKTSATKEGQTRMSDLPGKRRRG